MSKTLSPWVLPANPTTALQAAPKQYVDSSASSTAAAANARRLLDKLYRGTENASILVIGDSTSDETLEWESLTLQFLAAKFPAYTVLYRNWDSTGDTSYNTATTVQTGAGTPPVLTMWNFSVGGTPTAHGLGARWQAGLVAPDPDLILINHGYNEGKTAAGTTANHYRPAMLDLTESLTAIHPLAGLCMILQPLNSVTTMGNNASAYEQVAQLRGYGVIDVYGAFQAVGAYPTYFKVDTIHPTTSADSPAPNGSQLWADTVIACLTHVPANGAQIKDQQPSSLLTYAPDILVNGDFSGFAGSVPDSWTASGATTAKDTTGGHFESPTGWGVRIQATGSAPSYIQNSVSTFAKYAGKWVTFVVRMRVPAGQADTAGVIMVGDGSTFFFTDCAPSNRDGLMWQCISMRVGASPSGLLVRVYADTANSAGADITIDSAHLVEGVLPRIGVRSDSVLATSYQPIDSDLTTLGGLTATTDSFIQSKSSAWSARTPTQVAADLVTPLSTSLQPIDSDLTAIAAISPANDDVIQRKAGAWTNRTIAQLKTDLSLPATLPTLVSGNYYFTSSPHTTATSVTLGNGTARAIPWVVPPGGASLVRIGAEVTLAGNASSVIRLGIYADSGSGYPGALILDAGTIDGTSATVQEITISQTLTAGALVWFVGVVQVAATTQPTMRTASSWFPPIPLQFGGAIPGAAAVIVGLAMGGVTGALPGTFTTSPFASGAPARIFVKTA